jgi:hypothetical protein
VLIDKVACGRIRHPANGCHVSHLAVTRLVSPLGNATIRDGSSRVDAVPEGISQPHLASFPTAHQCRRAGIGVVREMPYSSGFCGPRDAATSVNVSISGMERRDEAFADFSLVVTASFVVICLAAWFVLEDPDLPFEKANATTSTAVPSKAVAPEPYKTAHAASGQ